MRREEDNLSFLLSKEEKEAKLRTFLAELNAIWQNPLFPSAHRPDVGWLQTHLWVVVELPIKEEASFHPGIKEKIRKKMESLLRLYESDLKSSKIAFFNDGGIYFLPEVFSYGDDFLVRVLAHEAATHNACQPKKIYPSSYSSFQKERVLMVLKDLFDKRTRPHLTNTWIEKRGFRELIFVGKWLVADVYSNRLIVAIDEIYPVAFELITAWIRKLGFEEFEKRAKAGNLPSFLPESHPRFSEALKKVIRIVDWRKVLDAFLTGLPDRARGILTEAPVYLGDDSLMKEIGGREYLFDFLVMAIASDEGISLSES